MQITINDNLNMFKIISRFNEIYLINGLSRACTYFKSPPYRTKVDSLMESRLYGYKSRSCASIRDFFAYDVVIQNDSDRK